MILALLLALAAPLQEDVDGLIRKLADDSITVREEAAAELLKRGEKVRAKLLEAAQSKDLEIQTRATRILGAIDRALKEKAWLPPPVPITLSGTMTLQEAAESVQRQGGRAITADSWPAGTFSVDIKDRPYWSALEEIARVGKASLICDPAGPKFVAGERAPVASQIRGQFRLHVARVVERRGFNFDQNKEDHSCSVILALGWEGARPPARLYVNLDAAIDDQGNDLASSMRQNLRFTGHDVIFSRPDKPIAASLLDLKGPALAPGVKRIARISGTLTAYFRGSDENMVIAASDFGEWAPVLEVLDEGAAEPVRGEARVIPRGAKGPDYPLSVSFRSLDSRLMCTMGDLWKLRNADGAEVSGWASAVAEDGPTTSKLDFEFRGAAGMENVKSLDVTIPRRLIRRDIPFELTDIRIR